MCGFVGAVFLGPEEDSANARQRTLLREVQTMLPQVRHRGPDDAGDWSDETGRIAMGHRRLAILDITNAGRQPMVSANGRWTLAFNGEIYNFRELRRELTANGAQFHSQSDTEVLLEAIAEWGLEAAIQRAAGMFAFAVWDAQARRLWLCRDRIGIKPLYFGRLGRRLLFGSELSAITAHSAATREWNRDAIASFLRHGYIPAPATAYRGVEKLPPGSLVAFDTEGRELVRAQHWSLTSVIANAREQRSQLSAAEARNGIQQAIHQAVRARLVADVPVGTFLSGGIDSTLVTAIAAKCHGQRLQTFCVGFDDPSMDESRHAAAIASHLGTDHHEWIVTANDAVEVVPQLSSIWDEPFADSSQIATLFVSRMARQHVTVVLSGDGGDEIAGGYARYRNLIRLRQRLQKVPALLRRPLSVAAAWQSRNPFAQNPHWWDLLGRFLRADRVRDLYREFHAHWKDPASLVIGAEKGAEWGWDEIERPGQPDMIKGWDPIEVMMCLDSLHYLPDDILTKVDRASMSVGLEARVPLLDACVIDAAWSMPAPSFAETPKQWLRELAYDHVPRELLERPKQGFGVPLADWIRGPLRDWSESLLREDAIKAQGLLQPKPIQRAWAEHQSGQRDWAYYLWDVIMLQDWIRKQSSGGVC